MRKKTKPYDQCLILSDGMHKGRDSIDIVRLCTTSRFTNRAITFVIPTKRSVVVACVLFVYFLIQTNQRSSPIVSVRLCVVLAIYRMQFVYSGQLSAGRLWRRGSCSHF